MRVSPQDGISALTGSQRGYFRCVRTQGESSHLQARKCPLPCTESTGTLILNSLGSRTMRKKCLFFNPPGLGHFVTAARVD